MTKRAYQYLGWVEETRSIYQQAQLKSCVFEGDERVQVEEECEREVRSGGSAREKSRWHKRPENSFIANKRVRQKSMGGTVPGLEVLPQVKVRS